MGSWVSLSLVLYWSSEHIWFANGTGLLGGNRDRVDTTYYHLALQMRPNPATSAPSTDFEDWQRQYFVLTYSPNLNSGPR